MSAQRQSKDKHLYKVEAAVNKIYRQTQESLDTLTAKTFCAEVVAQTSLCMFYSGLFYGTSDGDNPPQPALFKLTAECY